MAPQNRLIYLALGIVAVADVLKPGTHEVDPAAAAQANAAADAESADGAGQ